MKTKLVFILTLFFCSYAPEPEEKTISIIDYRHHSSWPTANLAAHKDKDIEIYKIDPIYRDEPVDTNLVMAAYMPIIYRLKNNQLESCQDHIFQGDIHYEKVSFYWLNDTTLKFRLYNSFNDLSERFKYVLLKNGSIFGIDD